MNDTDVSILIPCLDEEQTIARCVKQASESAKELDANYEVIVIDNNSTDGSARKAREAGARVVFEEKKGYGNAYKKGIREAKGRFVFMGDGDGTYDFKELKRFYKHLEQEKLDMVIGNRFKYELEKGVMPGLHKHIGNPLLSGLTRMLFKSKVRDVHCGMRLIRREELERMELASPGMEFATEMVIKAAKRKLNIGELPIRYKARETPSKLDSFNDGWRHLRFMLLFSPTTIFLLPGMIIFLIGILLIGLLATGPVQIGTLTLHTHPLFIGSLFTITGFQMLITGYFAKVFAANKYHDNGAFIEWLQKRLTLEKGLLTGGALVLTPIIIGITIVVEWMNSGFGGIEKLRAGIILLTLLILGVQIVFNSFYYISVQLVGEENEG
ncbi:MAG: glycosyltransferase family 2 protein [Candidatus Woesearchaeota archaeon]